MLRKLLLASLFGIMLCANSVNAANVIAYTTPALAVQPSADCASATQPIQLAFIINHFRIISRSGATLWQTSALSLAGQSGHVRMDAIIPEGFYALETWSVFEDNATTTNYCKTTTNVLIRSFTPYLPPRALKPLAAKVNYMLR